jgi:glutamyl-tRNA reductase
LLDSVVTRAFSVAKRVRTETEIGSSAVSVSFAAVELAREIFGGLSGQKIMLVGAGKMSTLTAKHLKGQGAAEIYITNRTYERAVELAKEFEGWIVDYESFPRSLPTVDIVIVSTGAPSYVIRKDQMRDVIRARRNRPMFLIDIAVPRQIEPSVNELDNVFLYDIDDLQQVVDRNLKGRLNAAEQAARIIDEEVGRLENRMRARGAANVIVGVQAQLEKIRAAEVERVHSKLGPLTPRQEEAIEALTRGIINKVAHGAIAELRKDPEGSAELIRRVFRIEAGSEGD